MAGRGDELRWQHGNGGETFKKPNGELDVAETPQSVWWWCARHSQVPPLAVA